MKKILASLLFIAGTLFAQKAVLVDVVSENILKVDINGKSKNLHLSGIELFAKANGLNQNLSFEEKEHLKFNAMQYIRNNLPIGSEVVYFVVYVDDFGVEKVWLDSSRLNYQMVRDGYALVDMNDTLVPSMFQMRMRVAMKYAKDNKLGLWGISSESMNALFNTNVHRCGWHAQKSAPALTKESVLNRFKDALPKSSRIHVTEKVALK